MRFDSDRDDYASNGRNRTRLCKQGCVVNFCLADNRTASRNVHRSHDTAYDNRRRARNVNVVDETHVALCDPSAIVKFAVDCDLNGGSSRHRLGNLSGDFVTIWQSKPASEYNHRASGGINGLDWAQEKQGPIGANTSSDDGIHAGADDGVGRGTLYAGADDGIHAGADDGIHAGADDGVGRGICMPVPMMAFTPVPMMASVAALCMPVPMMAFTPVPMMASVAALCMPVPMMAFTAGADDGVGRGTLYAGADDGIHAGADDGVGRGTLYAGADDGIHAGADDGIHAGADDGIR